jgi:hypothetical protein
VRFVINEGGLAEWQGNRIKEKGWGAHRNAMKPSPVVRSTLSLDARQHFYGAEMLPQRDSYK